MTSKFIPLHVHSHYSLLDGLSKPAQIVNRCIKLGYNACALTDHGTVAGAVSFIKACEKKCVCGHSKADHKAKCTKGECECTSFKFKVKPILGCEFYLCPQDAKVKDPTNRKLSHLVVLAKNLQGWRNLVKASSASNQPQHIYYGKPRLQLEQLAEFAKGEFIVFSGHMGSDLANILFKDIKTAYAARTKSAALDALHPDWKKRAIELVEKYKRVFGEENFYVEIQRIDEKNLPAALVAADCLTEVAIETNTRRVATPDAHYPSKEDAADQRVLLCSALETTLSHIQRQLDANEDVSLGAFFKSNNYHIPSLEEMEAIHTPDELANSVAIADRCESYDILGKPSTPTFPCPDNLTSDQYLTRLCDEGWEKKVVKKVSKKKHDEYKQRVQYELGVITKAKILSDYFLIVADYMTWARSRMLCGKGRGSGAGSLVSDLLNITDIDPLEYNLLFERFYNAGRNTADRVSLPDIDCDFPISRREEIKDYIKSKYGAERVAEMLTFTRMQGRGALKDVLRAHETCSFEEMNRITEFIPDESKIADELQLMREATGEASIIRWALENNSEGLKPWCYIDEEGVLQGPYAKRFEQAIRLEGTKRSQSRHPAGIIISASNLAEVCPMVYDKNTDQLIAGMEMSDLEAMGHVKFDILGVAFLDKAMGVQDLLRTGRIADYRKKSNVRLKNEGSDSLPDRIGI